MRSLLLAALLLPLPALAEDKPLTLAEAYKLSLSRSEQLAIAGAGFEEAAAKADEIFARVMPHISVNATETFQHVPPGQSGLFLQKNREQGWVSAHQPLFSGFREFLAFRSAKRTGAAAELGLDRAKHLLYRDVARAYLDLLSAQEAIRIRGSLVDITKDRVGDLKEFRKVGRARASELLAAESQLAANLAELEQAKAAEQVAQFALAFLTGLEERVSPAPVEGPAAAPALDAALSAARARPDVRARAAEKEAADLAVGVANRARWPVISADANWYFKRPPSFTQDVKWDATLTGTLALWDGGEIRSQAKQQKARLKSADAALSAAVRTAELETKSAHQDLASSAAVVASLESAEKLAADNAKAQSADYKLGQVTNLEVLGALNTLQQLRLRLSAARLDSYWSRVRLEVAAGVPGGSL